jgi:hypothetical protein
MIKGEEAVRATAEAEAARAEARANAAECVELRAELSELKASLETVKSIVFFCFLICFANYNLTPNSQLNENEN